MKTCSKCLEIKEEYEFTKDKSKKDGLYPSCKMCSRIEKMRHYYDNHEEMKAYNRACGSKYQSRIQAYRKRRVDHRRETLRKWRETNLEHARAYSREYQRKRMADPVFRARKALRSRLTTVLRDTEIKKAATTEMLLGCSYEEFVQHIESQFKPGMTWENHGVYRVNKPMTWHIDHITPCASFDLRKEENQRKCFHYTNMRPMWAVDNIVKSDTIES